MKAGVYIDTHALDRLSKASGITQENSNRKAHGVNMYSLIPSRDVCRPVYNGVFYERGVAVKTDGHALCAIHCEYPQSYEGKVIAESGEEIQMVFPSNWRDVIPVHGNELDLQMFLRGFNDLPKGTSFIGIRGNAFSARVIKQAVRFIHKAKDVRLYWCQHIGSHHDLMAVADGGIFLLCDHDLRLSQREYVVNINC